MNLTLLLASVGIAGVIGALVAVCWQLRALVEAVEGLAMAIAIKSTASELIPGIADANDAPTTIYVAPELLEHDEPD